MAGRECKEAILIVAGDGKQGPAVEASFNLASNGGELLECVKVVPHNSLQVLLHGVDCTLPQTTKVWRSWRRVMPSHSMVGEKVMLNGRVCAVTSQPGIQPLQLIFGPCKVRAIVRVNVLRTVPPADKPAEAGLECLCGLV